MFIFVAAQIRYDSAIHIQRNGRVTLFPIIDSDANFIVSGRDFARQSLTDFYTDSAFTDTQRYR